MVASLVAFATVNDVLYGGLTPYSAADPGRPATGASDAGDYLERVPRLVGLFLDRDGGLLRWAPVLALAFGSVWLLWRSRRERLADLLPERLDVEIAAALALLVCGATVAVAAFGAPTTEGSWFPGRHLVAALPCAAALCAWVLRHAPRTGAALGAVTLLGSAWLLVALRTGGAPGWADPGISAPWGPLVDVLPVFGEGSAWAGVLASAAAVLLAALVAREWRARRSVA
jgi:hypothetical protein